jgi:hypothetical protein
MPDMNAVRAAIIANVSGVADIGQLHDYERYAKNQSEMRSFYESTINGTKQIRGWHLVRKSAAVTNPAVWRDTVKTEWELRGFMSLDDDGGSEKTFDSLVELIRAEMRTDPDLGNVANTAIAGTGPAGWQVEEVNKVMFAGVLCHHARMRLTTVHHEP